MKIFSEFIVESNRKAQKASKSGRTSKEGPRSREKSEPSAVVTVGLPASGKSSLAKHMAAKGDTDQHELDKSRKALGKGPAYFGQDIVKHTYDGAKKSAEQGRSTVLSNTSIPKAHRKDAINKLKDVGYEKVTAVLAPGSKKAAMRRNRNRKGSAPGEGAVPQFVMNRMAQGMDSMSKAERKELRGNYKKLHKSERFTKPAMKRSGAIKEQKTFTEFIVESRLKAITTGPSRSRVGLDRQRKDASERAAFRRSGMRRSTSGGRYPHKFTTTGDQNEYSRTTISSYPSQSAYARDMLPDKDKNGKGVVKTQDRALYLKRLKRQLKTTRTKRKVHNVDVLPRGDYKKNDSKQLVSRGKEYHNAVKEIPQEVKKSGGKAGDKIVGKAAEVMPGSKDVEKGRKSRRKLYSKVLGATEYDPVTRIQVATVKE
jgi:predicted kinase